jgi:hypothetical protein
MWYEQLNQRQMSERNLTSIPVCMYVWGKKGKWFRGGEEQNTEMSNLTRSSRKISDRNHLCDN